MIEVRIPKEITEYKEKIIFGLSIRQIICFSIAVAMALGTWFILRPILGDDITSDIIIVEVIPCVAIGFIKINGFNFEDYAKLFIRHKLGDNKFTYKTETELEYIEPLGKEEWTSGDNKVKSEDWEGIWMPNERRKERIKRQKKELVRAKREYKKGKSAIPKEVRRQEKTLKEYAKSA